MKSTLLFLSVFLTTTNFSQVEDGFLVIENKGKSKCFFDDSDPNSFINLIKQKANTQGSDAIRGYAFPKYSDLDYYSARGPLLRVEIDGYEEVLYTDPEIPQSFDVWYDSIVSLSWDPTTSDLLRFDKVYLFDRWCKSLENFGPQLLREDDRVSYASLKNIHTLIIEYRQYDSDSIFYGNVYFVRNVDEEAKPVITAQVSFPNSFDFKYAFELSQDEGNSIWNASREFCLSKKLDAGSAYDLPYDFTENYGIAKASWPDYQQALNFGRKFSEKRIGAPIELSYDYEDGAFISYLERQSFNEWYDSIVDLSFDPTTSDLLTFDKKDLKKRWTKCIYSSDKLIREDDEIITYWWDFSNYSAHLAYSLNIDLDYNSNTTEMKYKQGEAFFAVKSGELIIPLTVAKYEGTLLNNAFEKFKKENSKLLWAELIHQKKAGDFVIEDFQGIKKIQSIVISPEDDTDVWSLGWVFSGFNVSEDKDK
jgi:hypothetical protein